VARSHHDDHENGLIDDARTSGEAGAMAPRTMVLFAFGFVLGAVAIGSMGIAITPDDPPAVRPVELRFPNERERRGEGADRRRDRSEPRRDSERRERRRSRAPAAPAPPPARLQPGGQATPPSASPRSRTPAPRPTPAPRQTPQPPPAATGPSQPAPPAPAAPPADDDDAGEDPVGDEDAGEPGELNGED
jgi:hypothetical protein